MLFHIPKRKSMAMGKLLDYKKFKPYHLPKTSMISYKKMGMENLNGDIKKS